MSNASPSTSQPSHQLTLPEHFAQLATASLCAHLNDSTGHTILTTSTTARQSHSLQALSHAYLSAHDTAFRMGLGVPVRVTVTTRAGTAVIQTGSQVASGEMVVGTVVGPVERVADARVASWGVEEVAGRVGRVIGEARGER